MKMTPFFYIFASADSWPEVFDDQGARKDWGWNHSFDLNDLVKVMFDYLHSVYSK